MAIKAKVQHPSTLAIDISRRNELRATYHKFSVEEMARGGKEISFRKFCDMVYVFAISNPKQIATFATKR